MISRTALPSLLASFVLLVGVSQSVAQQLCKPTLTLKEARTSDARNQQRTWTPGLVVNASRCSTTSGSFEIQLTRLKEIAPDLRFTERFAWSSGQTEMFAGHLVG